MPRRTYRHRLQDLIDNPAISSRDKDFSRSLLTHYERKGNLSSDRARWVKKLEARYSPDVIAANLAKGQVMLARLNAICERTGESSWARGFINSLQGQVMTGKELTERQIKSLAKIESEHSDAAMSARQTWARDFAANKDNSREIFAVAVGYYRPTSYFGNIISKWDRTDGFVPTIATFNKMTKNKYAVKAIKAHLDPPAFAAGTMVRLRAGAPRKGWKTNYGAPLVAFAVPALVIAANAAPVTSAAKGAKVYKLLPVGMAQTILIEERHIRKARKSDLKVSHK